MAGNHRSCQKVGAEVEGGSRCESAVECQKLKPSLALGRVLERERRIVGRDINSAAATLAPLGLSAFG